MVAAPQRGTLVFEEILRPDQIGAFVAERLTKETYISDVDKANGTFDAGAGAGSASPVKFTLPFDAKLKDFSITTGLTDTTKGALTKNGQQTGDMLRWGNHVNTLAQRPIPDTVYLAGEEFGIIQLA